MPVDRQARIERHRAPWLGLFACLLASAAAGAAPPPAIQEGREALRRSIDALLLEGPLAGARIGLEVVSLEDGQVVHARAADQLLNPASNTKLVTAAAALLRLGPEFRFVTDLRTDKKMRRGRLKNLYLKGRGDPTFTTERLHSLASDLWHRGVRVVQGDLVFDDSYFDGELWGPGWEEETSDKSYAAPAAALSLNQNAVSIYVFPADRQGTKARVEVEPESRYLTIENRVATVRGRGRRRIVAHTTADGGQTRVTVRGRVPVGRSGLVLQRRVYDPALYFGETFKLVLAQRGIRVKGKVKHGKMPEDAEQVATYESDELAEIVRDMNKASSNFIAEVLFKTLGAEVKGAPGSWPKGAEVAGELLAELGLPRGSYVLKNGSGLNDTNRFTAHQMTVLLQTIWKRFPVAAEFVSSLGIAARDGTLRLRMEGTDAAGRLRGKTGTLDNVTALSGYVGSVGGERFAFSILVNDWEGRTAPVVHSVDRLGGLIAAVGAPQPSPRDSSLAALAAARDAAAPAELRARFASYVGLAQNADKKNLTFLRGALRTERDALLRAAAADALYQTDSDHGASLLLEALPVAPDLFVRIRALAREMSLPLPVISSLLDLGSDGNGEALARLLALAPLARGPGADELLLTLLGDGLVEVGHNASDELLVALRSAPVEQARAAFEVLGYGLASAGEDVRSFAIADAVRAAAAGNGPDGAEARTWLLLLQRRPIAPMAVSTSPLAAAAPAVAHQDPPPPAPAAREAPAASEPAPPARSPAAPVEAAVDARPAPAAAVPSAPIVDAPPPPAPATKPAPAASATAASAPAPPARVTAAATIAAPPARSASAGVSPKAAAPEAEPPKPTEPAPPLPFAAPVHCDPTVAACAEPPPAGR